MFQPLVVQCPDGPAISSPVSSVQMFQPLVVQCPDGPAIGSPASECTQGETLWMNEGVLNYEIKLLQYNTI